MAITSDPALEVRRDDGWTALDRRVANRGFTELHEETFRVSGGEGLRLLVDDAPLDPEGAGEWRWKPGFYAGLVFAELLTPEGRARGRWRLDVSPDPKKLGEDLWAHLVDEILSHDPTLVIGLEPAHRRLGALGETSDPLVALERLRRRENELGRALAAIHREPRSVSRTRREWLPLHQVRRADLRTLRAASRQPGVLAALPRTRPSTPASGPSHPSLLDVPTVEQSLDSPANRAALFMLRALRRRAGQVRDRLREEAHKEGDVGARTGIRARLPRWEEILERMSRNFGRAERRSPFRDARHPEITAAGLNAVAANPLYAQFWRVGWEALRRGVDRRDPEDELPLSPTWEIYERWCFVELVRRLREWLPTPEWKESRERANGDRRTIRFRRSDGASVSIFLQKAAGTKGNPLRSVSFECRPDLVVRWEYGASSAGFVVLDAKYRASRQAILNGMRESAHPYQDALRWGDERPATTLLLVPDASAVEWLSHLEFINQNRVGAVTLRPDTELPRWFPQLLLGGLAEVFQPGGDLVVTSAALHHP